MDRTSFLKHFRVGGFYHFTDQRNLPSIRSAGGLFSLEQLKNRGIVPPAPGGNEWSHDADAIRGLDKYVHLCFRQEHPMEYVARTEGRLGTTVFLSIEPGVLLQEGVMFTPDVSNKSGVPLLSFEEALEAIDFSVLYERHDWRDPEVKERMKLAKKCELLVPDMVPLSMIRGI
jgi:hypothetical protein